MTYYLLVRWGRFALVCAGVVGLAITSGTSAALAEATSVRGEAMAPAAGGSGGQQLWVTRYSGASGTAVAASPKGGAVFVTGNVTIGYDTATGAQLWVSHYDGPAKMGSAANAVTVSPNGSRVFVTGETWNAQRHPEYATVAYSAATGRQLWVRRYNGPGNLNDAGTAVAVSPDNATVVVTGFSTGKGGQYDIEWATIAYTAKTGAALWTKRYGVLGCGTTENAPYAVVMNPRGGTVYVTGLVADYQAQGFYGTVAYSVSTGTRKWAETYPEGTFSYAAALAISPDGHTLYVTGHSEIDTVDIATIAYRA